VWKTLLESFEFYPPGSKSEALRLAVHLIVLYFIRISFFPRRILFYFGVDVGVDVDVDVDGGLFFFFKSFDNNMVYSLDIDIYLCKRYLCRTKVLWVLKFGEVGDRINKNQNPPRYENLLFFVQNFIF